MADAMDALPERVDAVEEKLDGLSASVDARFDAVDARFEAVDARFDAVDARFDAMDAKINRRFDEVTAALVEQRQYTEFAFERLRGEMKDGFAAMTDNFGRLERKLDRLIDRMLGPSAS